MLLVDLLAFGRMLGGVDGGVRGLAVDVPLLELDAHHRQRQHRGHDVGQMLDEVDLTGFDVLVECGAGDLVDERLPALDRRRGQVGVQRPAVLAVLGLVHLEDAAANHGRATGLGNGDALERGLTGDVVMVGHRGAAGELEHVRAVGGHPVPAVGVGPGHRALGLHLLGDLLELQPILGGVPVEVIPVLLAVVGRDIVDAHGVVSLFWPIGQPRGATRLIR